MNGTTLLPLRAAIQQALHDARVTRRKSSAGVVTLLAISATALSPEVMAADSYTANDETTLRTAIDNASGDGDPSATITLTGDITLSSTTAFSPLTKPLTINTNGFALNAQSGVTPGGSLTFSGSNVTVTGSGQFRGGNSTDGTGVVNGGAALTLSGNSLINQASISGGNGGNNSVNNGGNGGAGVLATRSTITSTAHTLARRARARAT